MSAPNKTARGNATRDKILWAAEQVFADNSFSAARLEDVAQAVGIRRASLVYYFKSKQELYEAVEGRIFEAMTTLTQQRVAKAESNQDKLLSILDSWLDFHAERVTSARLIMRNIADRYPAGENPIQFAHTLLELWDSIVRDAQEQGELGPMEPTHLLEILGGGILH